MALGRLGRGQALIRAGGIDDGVALLDETMAAAGVLREVGFEPILRALRTALDGS